MNNIYILNLEYLEKAMSNKQTPLLGVRVRGFCVYIYIYIYIYIYTYIDRYTPIYDIYIYIYI